MKAVQDRKSGKVHYFCKHDHQVDREDNECLKCMETKGQDQAPPKQ